MAMRKVLKVFTRMKQYRFQTLIAITFLFFPAISPAQQCVDSSVNLGKIDSAWLYNNPSFHFSFKLPDGWYFFDQLASQKKYIRIGSDYKKLSAPLADDGPGPIVGLDQIKEHPLDFSLNLFSLARFNDTVPDMPAANELQQNKTVSCKAYYAEIKDSIELLKALYKKYTGGSKDEPQIKTARLGELEYSYFSLLITNKAGVAENRIFGVRNFGCVNLIVRITYLTDADLAAVDDACKDLKFAQ
jgi:hypothetical protein